MKIEAGKFYRATNGAKVKIYSIDNGGEYCVHGAVQVDGYWNMAIWTIDGFVYKYEFSDFLDIVAEWEEKPKKKRRKCYMHAHKQMKGMLLLLDDDDLFLDPSIRRDKDMLIHIPHLDEPEDK